VYSIRVYALYIHSVHVEICTQMHTRRKVVKPAEGAKQDKDGTAEAILIAAKSL